MVSALLTRIRHRLPNVGFHTGQLRNRHDPDLNPESLLEAIVELQDHIDGEAARHPWPSTLLAANVARKLNAFARELGSHLTAATGRAWTCRQASAALQGPRNPPFDVLLMALESLLEESEERVSEAREHARIVAVLATQVGLVEDQMDAMTDELGVILGERSIPTDPEERWPGLLVRVRDLVVPSICPVPGCADPAVADPRPLFDGECPVALCSHHMAVRFEVFQAAVAAAMPDYRGAIHEALFPFPRFAHLAPSPEALRGPPPRTRMQRVLPDDE
ncbi:MAG TPA: hypothetical protein VF316_24650 [Polyangiaceae bacterium]